MSASSYSDEITAPLYIGLMSGTSLDGVDGALAASDSDGRQHCIATHHQPFPPALRSQLLELQSAGENEIEREALAANALAACYAACVAALLERASVTPAEVRAIGAHGQTIRHRPELGFSRQTNNAALLAELSGIAVVADFRARDIAAGGQGAPLVPAYHHAVFAKPGVRRVVVNIGGIANISVLDGHGGVRGFDTGPGNVLMDGWIGRHQGCAYDANGAWAARGVVQSDLLASLLQAPYFGLPAPKSTGRDLFHLAWLDAHLAGHGPRFAPADVQATLAALTAATIGDAILAEAPDAEAVYLCGGGARNTHLVGELTRRLRAAGSSASVASTDVLGVAPTNVEAMAFAWLAQRCIDRQSGNLAGVTGAAGARVLGAIYPA